MPDMTTQVTGGADVGAASPPPMDTSAGMADSPMARAFDTPGDDLTGELGDLSGVGDMTPSIGPRRGLASFWAGSQDAGSGD
jgi:hypothetical protein